MQIQIADKKFNLVATKLSFNIKVANAEKLEDQASVLLEHLNGHCKAVKTQKDMSLESFLESVDMNQFNELFMLLKDAGGKSLTLLGTA